MDANKQTANSAEQAVTLPALMAYEGTAAVPPAAGWPLNKALWEPFVDVPGRIITFTALVPLERLLNGRGDVSEYLEEAFDGTVSLSDVEYRVVGGGTPGDGWDYPEEGDVALQVSGTLHSR